MSDHQKPKWRNIRMGIIIDGATLGSWLVLIWRSIMHNRWTILVLLVLALGGLFVWKKRTAISAAWKWVRALTDPVNDIDSALSLRSLILGDVVRFNVWNQELILDPSVPLEFKDHFNRVNDSFLETFQDRFPQTQIERIAIFVPTQSKQELTIAYSARFEPTRQTTLKLPIDSAAGYTFSTGERYYSGDITNEAHSRYRKLAGSTDIRTLLCVPLQDPKGNVHGVVSMDHKSINTLDEDTIELIETLCKLITVAWVFKTHREEQGGSNCGLHQTDHIPS
ncbi:MAG: GAF domain-containing protein [Sulfobacillus sp.]